MFRFSAMWLSTAGRVDVPFLGNMTNNSQQSQCSDSHQCDYQQPVESMFRFSAMWLSTAGRVDVPVLGNVTNNSQQSQCSDFRQCDYQQPVELMFQFLAIWLTTASNVDVLILGNISAVGTVDVPHPGSSESYWQTNLWSQKMLTLYRQTHYCVIVFTAFPIAVPLT